MTQRVSTGAPETAKSNQRLAILLAMASRWLLFAVSGAPVLTL